MFMSPAFIGVPSGWELILLAVIVLVLFGTRLPKVMRSLGSSITEFKKGVNEGVEDDQEKPVEPRVESKAS